MIAGTGRMSRVNREARCLPRNRKVRVNERLGLKSPVERASLARDWPRPIPRGAAKLGEIPAAVNPILSFMPLRIAFLGGLKHDQGS